MPGLEGSNILVLGGGGMVGEAVCTELARHDPARLAVAARRERKARRTVEQIRKQFPALKDKVVPVWGDVFLRADWQGLEGDVRARVMADSRKRSQLIADILDPLDADILQSSLLFKMIAGLSPRLDGASADIVIDCMNTATAVSYQDIYSLARRMIDKAKKGDPGTDWQKEAETLAAALSVPQLVRHVQILYGAMRDAGTRAYVKVGTSGTGGMGFNIPYTHGEEKPSRLLLSKAALAGAQTLLTFLMARTPDAPPLVREIKPTALIGWHEIGFGPISRRGRNFPLYDCSSEQAVSIQDPANLALSGDFGHATDARLEGVYIDTGENGIFSADEFAAITTLGQMQFITPEEVAHTVVVELLGGSTGTDVIAALDASASGPTYRAGYLRQSALTRMRQLEAEHGQSVAFELLGPPRLSKLLYEAHLLKSVTGTLEAGIAADANELAQAVAARVDDDADLRRRILSIGLAILLPDGERLLRGPVMKSQDAYHGWVDLTPDNMRRWQDRFRGVRDVIEAELAGQSSSRFQRIFTPSRDWMADPNAFEIGEIAGWIFVHEEGGERLKS
jgi:NAD(P)-dependent dehydrogenase (short-subunit alcohol dehydrogenase family)